MPKFSPGQAAYVVSGIALLALSGCGGGSPDDGYAGPPPSSYQQDKGPAPLLGGTPPPAHDGYSDQVLAGGPGMAAIPNPENLPLAERQAIYGHKYDHLKYRPLPGQSTAPSSSKTPSPSYGEPAPAAHPARGELKTWRDSNGKLVVSNRPIANPEDMTPAERQRVYGKRYAPRAYSASPVRRKPAYRPAPSYAPTYSAPKPKPVVAKPAPAYRPAAPKAAVAPPQKMVTKPAPAPIKAAPPAPIAKVAPPPAPKLAPPALKVPVAPPASDPKMAALSAAVGPQVTKGSVLTIPEGLAKGEESRVSLSLPVDLLSVIQGEAAKLGLAKAARKAEVSATLTGDGYTITPNGAQTQLLKKGEAATFNWQVKPGDGEKSPLKATVDGALKGQKKARTFSIASIEQLIAETVEATKSQASKMGLPSLDKLAIPGLKPISVGGTVISPGALTAGILAFLILLIAVAMGRAGASRRARAERRRKFRTMTDYGRTEETDVEPVRHEVNPMVAAAGGAAVGATAMTFAADDHEPAHAEAPAYVAPAPVEAAHPEAAPVEAPQVEATPAEAAEIHPEPTVAHPAPAEPVAHAAEPLAYSPGGLTAEAPAEGHAAEPVKHRPEPEHV
jgi:hypothetical protein